jgi:hypothetical protein
MTGGFIAGNIVAGLIGLLCLVAIVLGILIARDDHGGYGLAIGGFVVLLLTFGAWLWASWPLAYDYHHWVDQTVKVEEVSKRQVSNGDKGMYEKFVVRDESGAMYGIDDTRASLIKQGDTVHVRCKKAYQYGVSRGAHGWDCRWAG